MNNYKRLLKKLERITDNLEYRKLGRAGVRVSTISLGSWLTYGGSVGKDSAKACIERAYDLGINLFDTSDAYYRGGAETVLGEVLQNYTRSSYVLATKVFFPTGDGPNDKGLSRKHIFESCHASLKRLQTDYIDLYQCHRYDPETPLDETLVALDDLVRQGKVLYVGVSEWTAQQIEDAALMAQELGLSQIVSNQPQYSMLQRRIEAEVLPTSEQYGIGQIVFSPLGQGVLTGKYHAGQPLPEGSRATDPKSNQFITQLLQDNLLQAVEKLHPIAESQGMSLAQLALAWILRQPGVSSAIVGATRPDQLEDNVKASGRNLDAGTQAAIDEVLDGISQFE